MTEGGNVITRLAGARVPFCAALDRAAASWIAAWRRCSPRYPNRESVPVEEEGDMSHDAVLIGCLGC